MTAPSNAEELKDVLWRIGAFDLLDHDQHVELQRYILARERQVLTELLGELPDKQYHTTGPNATFSRDDVMQSFSFNEAIDQVVSVIEKLKQTNDGEAE